jgi:prevent-host-death family protein
MSTKTTQVSLLDFRNNLGNFVAKANQKPLKLTKRGQTVGVVLSEDLAEEFLDWKKRQELKKFYLKVKPGFAELGRKFLAEKGLKEEDLTEDELVDLVANA